MPLKVSIIIIASFILSGCQEKTADTPFPGPLALGANITTFTPPAITKTADLPEPPPALPHDFADPNGVINLQQALALALLKTPS